MARKIIISEYIEDVLPEISDTDAGWILRAVFAMNKGIDPGEPPPTLRVAWKGIRRQQEAMIAKYEATCAARSTAGKAGNVARWGGGTIANASKCDNPYRKLSQTVANAIKEKEKEREKETNRERMGGTGGASLPPPSAPALEALAAVGANAAALAGTASALAEALSTTFAPDSTSAPPPPAQNPAENPPNSPAKALAASGAANCPSGETNAPSAAISPTPASGGDSSPPFVLVSAPETPPGKPATRKPPPSASRFVPPSAEDVRAYCAERRNGVDADHFVAYYTANGWRVGRNPMKDWRAAVRTWERNGFSGPTPPHKQHLKPRRESGITDYRDQDPRTPPRSW